MIKTIALIGWLLAPAMLCAAEPPLHFSLPDMNGTIHTLDRYQGKWVIVNYWSTRCPPCLKEIPELMDFHARHKDRDAVVLGVNFEDIATPWLREFITNIGMNYPVLLAGTSPHTPFGPIVVLPTTFLVSPDGKLIGRQTGAVTAKTLDAYIEARQSTPEAAGKHVRTARSPQKDAVTKEPHRSCDSVTGIVINAVRASPHPTPAHLMRYRLGVLAPRPIKNYCIGSAVSQIQAHSLTGFPPPTYCQPPTHIG